MRLKLAVFTVAVCAIGAGAVALMASADNSQLDQARNATAAFQNFANLPKEFGQLKDKNGIACIDMPAMPGMPASAMGIHYVNGNRVGDPNEIASKPEAIIYEPQADGSLKLVAVEYVVLKSAWDADHTGRPHLFGQEFNFTTDNNRFGLPPFYSLHAWLWKHNPAGMFAPFNPDVTCANA
jgi:hypothetical protein